jgi:hypothetical protein
MLYINTTDNLNRVTVTLRGSIPTMLSVHRSYFYRDTYQLTEVAFFTPRFGGLMVALSLPRTIRGFKYLTTPTVVKGYKKYNPLVEFFDYTQLEGN